ncbi:hypothetical protein niasHT_038588 [Heterodera trifolii]|uniref:Uncharacterized protein n=1 Tax=Heterodera trifolii TaxID=157864 RepID=A0ABD2I7E9_9BILA
MQLSIIENGICYTIIIICGFKIVKFVHKNAYRNATHGQQVHKQLTINLIIKALLPLAMNILNFSVAIQLLFFQTEMSPNFLFLQMCASIPAYWLPVLNPLVTICTVSDYRSALSILIRPITSSRNRNAGVFAADDQPQIRVIRPTNYANPTINNYVK